MLFRSSDGTAKGTFEVFQCEKKENCEKIHVGCVNAQPLIFIKEFEPSKVTVSKIDENGDIGKTVFEINDADFTADPQSVNMESSEKHFFPMYTPDNGTELWKTDGTESGTVMVKDISSGVEGSNPEIVAVHEGTVYFTASDGLNGYELWKTDGTESGTVMVNDFFSGTGSSSVKEVTVTESGLVLSGKDSKGVDTLWLIKDY